MEKTDRKEQLNEIYEKLESGDISVAEGIKQANTLTAELAKAQAVDEAGKRTQEVFFNKDVQAAQEQWQKDYPDYQEFVESGKGQEYMSKNPMLIDQTIAYFQWKADQRFEDEEEPKKPASFKGDKTEKPLTDDDLLNFQLRTIEKMKNRRPVRQEPITLREIESQQMDTLKKMRGE